ncbi:MAG: tRNA dihydrouridine synthase DusB [Micrococcales bacterium]|nr:MAG: tRNA dihydrouridine synthase DusB [Micrococcales bacterium]
MVLAPMAGITNQAYRALCREFGPGGVYVNEMITSRAMLERTAESMRLLQHDPGEYPRSVQLYGVDPTTIALAVRMIRTEDRADHIDLNFGCPVAKVTRKGGGAALPWKADLFRRIVAAAVQAAGELPVTVKMRKGIDDEHLTYLDAGLAAEAEGAAAIALHARTAHDYYGGQADWDAIARLKQAVGRIPVLGNGDIWTAQDALAMMARTGCDGVVIGRGCLGRPWLFADLANAFAGRDERARPNLGEVADVLRRHAHLLVAHHGHELRALRDLRKHMSWYLKGYPAGGDLRARLGMVGSLTELDALLDGLDRTVAYPGAGAEGPRGRTTGVKEVKLPEGWLRTRELTGTAATMIAEAELSVSGG